MLQPRTALRSLQRGPSTSTSLFSAFFPVRGYATQTLDAKIKAQIAEAGVSPQDAVAYAPPPLRDYNLTTQPLRTYKPRTPGVRHLRRPVNDHLWKGRPIERLTFAKTGQGKGGRNCTGHITVRHRGGGHKRRIRTVDFDRTAPGEQVVERIEYDPNRTAHLALLRDKASKRLSYIIAAEGMRAGDVVQSYRSGIPEALQKMMGDERDSGVLAARTAWRGNCLPLHMIPVGSLVYNIGMIAGGKAIFCRSAGTYGTVVAKGDDTVQKLLAEARQSAILEGKSLSKLVTEKDTQRMEEQAKFVTIKLKSGEVRLIDKHACATIGVASNAQHELRQLGKAGRKRWLGIRPTVRGLAMNAMDHPHGGGRGKSKGNIKSKSPWGLPAKGGYKTRNKHKINKMVVTPRPRFQGIRKRGYN